MLSIKPQPVYGRVNEFDGEMNIKTEINKRTSGGKKSHCLGEIDQIEHCFEYMTAIITIGREAIQ